MHVADRGGVILATAAVAYRWAPGVRQWAIALFLEETGELWSPASNHHRPKSPTRRGRLQPSAQPSRPSPLPLGSRSRVVYRPSGWGSWPVGWRVLRPKLRSDQPGPTLGVSHRWVRAQPVGQAAPVVQASLPPLRF